MECLEFIQKKKLNVRFKLANRANKFLNHRGPDEFNLFQDKENNLILCHSDSLL